MNKLRAAYVYNLEGKIVGIRTRKAPENSAHYGKKFYQLKVEDEDGISKNIQVFQDKLTDYDIWENVQQGTCKGKFYYFECRNRAGNYHLINWKELKNHD